MDHDALTIFGEIRQWVERHHTVFYVTLCAIMMGLVYVLVYNTGGIKYVYSHTMYIPILIGGLALGRYWAVLIAAVAGMLLGPIMPIEVSTGENQEFINWFYRLVMFVMIGGLSGLASDINKKNRSTIMTLLSHHTDTRLPNINTIKTYAKGKDLNGSYVFLSLVITNKDTLVTTVGIPGYHNILKHLYEEMRSFFPDDTFIAQIDSVKFWVLVSDDEESFRADDMLQLLDKTYKVESIPLFVDLNAGFFRKQLRHATLEPAMFDESDIAVDYAKRHHLSYVRYQDTIENVHGDMVLLAGVLDGLEQGEFKLVYQPKFDVDTMEPIGFEALIRWHHPKHGLIMPDGFIPMIEDTQLIHRLTDYVIEETLKKIEAFREAGHDVSISVNLSTRNLYDPNFYDRTMSLFTAHGADPSAVGLEITENILLDHPKKGKTILAALTNAGFSIAIDDFGKGYSSLAYLSEYELDVIKIDRDFVMRMAADETDKNIVKAAIVLGHELNCDVIAEGVETEETWRMLKDMGCEYAQGFYYEKPIPSEDVIPWYASKKTT